MKIDLEILFMSVGCIIVGLLFRNMKPKHLKGYQQVKFTKEEENFKMRLNKVGGTGLIIFGIVGVIS